MFGFVKGNIKPEGNRTFEGPRCCWITWTEGFGLDSCRSRGKQISSWLKDGITRYGLVCDQENLAFWYNCTCNWVVTRWQ